MLVTDFKKYAFDANDTKDHDIGDATKLCTPLDCRCALVDRPTQLICISDIYLLTDNYKRHSRAIC